jgi:ArsR family transcriptional regulator
MVAQADRRRDERTRVLKAMAHPSRLLILETLVEGERCVCDLQRVVGADISTVSKHLALMRLAGLVIDRRQGLQVFYRLRVPCVLDFLDCVDAVRSRPAATAPRRPRLYVTVPSPDCCARTPLARRAAGRGPARTRS